MRLLEDEEWCQWSDRAIAKKCGVSHDLVNRVRKSICQKMTDTNLNTKRKVKRGEKVYVQDTANIGKGKQTESQPADSDSEQLNQDREVPNLEENTPTNEAVDASKTDDVNNHDDSAVDNDGTEVQANSKPKQSIRQKQGKQRLVNPLSIGDKVKVKENHYFGGQEGIVTQLATPYSVIVAFDNDERDLIKLTELDLPTELTKPILVNESKSEPVKKEILIKEGANYKAGEGCRWYIEVEENDYRLFQQLQKQNNAPSIRSYLVRLAEEKKEEELPPSDDILVNLSSKVVHLNKQQKLFLAQKLMESDSELLTQLIEILRQGEGNRGTI
jgi:hypothetical protein